MNAKNTNPKIQDLEKLFRHIPPRYTSEQVVFGSSDVEIDPNSHVQGVAVTGQFIIFTHSDARCSAGLYLLAEQGSQMDEALKYAQTAVELAPTEADYCDTLGWILYRKGLYTSAITYLERASANSGNVVWKYHLAMAYAKAGDTKRSREAYDEGRKLNPNLPEAKTAGELLSVSN